MALFGDQKGNVGAIVKEGWAIELELETLDEKSLEDAIVEILKNTKYSRIVKNYAKLSRDRPMNAHETATFWIEYVIRHHGAPHLHYPGADQNILQKNSLDVIGFILAVVYVLLKTVKFIFGKLFGLCCKKSNVKVKKN
jgi:glucuronosyltransferase